MSKIQVLPEILANKIAAGEIVERPASVVKELIENSIDAACRGIRVVVNSGGKRLLSVRDDGEGMSQDDAILAFEHHATSKIRHADDLSSIATLGFRGEALPSVASVSRLTMRTRSAESASASGTEIEIYGGVLRSVKPISWDRGTEVIVRDLFFNVPARRKFLRSNDTESGHIARLVTHYALARPEIRFFLESDGRTLVDAVPVPTLKERVFQLFGDGFLDHMVEFSGQSGSVRIHGFTSRPHEQRTNPYSQYFYVNRRMVRDKVITSAIRQAYRNCIPASAYPVVILFVELPFDQVDVNAHPAKTEIRFRQQEVVHSVVRESIERALTRGMAIPHYTYSGDNRKPPIFEAEPLPVSSGDMVASGGTGSLDLTPPAADRNPLQRTLDFPFSDTRTAHEVKLVDHARLKVLPEMLFGSPVGSNRLFQSGAVRILGQLQESYIIACDSQGLLIVDQHVAHERILYEKLAVSMQKDVVESQGLLVPISLDLSPGQLVLIDKVMPELIRNGFQLERFGGTSVVVRSVPAVAKDTDCRSLLSEILEGLEDEERILNMERIRDKIAVSTACRAAIKINMALTFEKMQWLIDQLAQTRMPTSCPHGRPIVLRFSTYEIERNFGRI